MHGKGYSLQVMEGEGVYVAMKGLSSKEEEEKNAWKLLYTFPPSFSLCRIVTVLGWKCSENDKCSKWTVYQAHVKEKRNARYSTAPRERPALKVKLNTQVLKAQYYSLVRDSTNHTELIIARSKGEVYMVG